MQSAKIKGRGARFVAAAVGGDLGKYSRGGSGACERSKRPGSAFNDLELSRRPRKHEKIDVFPKSEFVNDRL